MHIRYRIEPTGKKYGWRQGGQDCWYYAAKSLLRFYGLVNTKSDKLWAHLQTAKLIRMFINGMRAIHGKDLHHPMLSTANLREWVAEEKAKIEKTRKDIVSVGGEDVHLQQEIQALLENEELWTEEKLLSFSRINQELAGMLKGAKAHEISANRYTFLKVGETILRFSPNWKDKLWTISEIFNTCFPADLFQAVTLREKTPEELYGLLVKHGPMWTTGELGAGDKTPYTLTIHGPTPEEDISETRVVVENYVTDSKHAVTVYGVSTDSGMVEYADPNDFTKPRRVLSGMFFNQLRVFEFNSLGTNFLAVKTKDSKAVLESKQIAMW